jgi:lactoylglutathione lyase
MQFLHITISVKDMGTSLDFYHGLLGLKILRRIPTGGGGELVFIGEEGQPSIELVSGHDGGTAKSGFSIGFRVDSLSDCGQILYRCPCTDIHRVRQL